VELMAGLLTGALVRQRQQLLEGFRLADAAAAERASAEVPLREAAGRQGEDVAFRPITADARRELSPLTIDRMHEIASYLYLHNPIARRLIALIREWVVGEGVSVHSGNELTQAYLLDHWTSRSAGWQLRIEQRCGELWLFGEQCWPVWWNQFNGQARLGVLDTRRIGYVVVDPENVLTPIGIVTKSLAGIPERRIRLVRRDDDVLSEAGDRELATFNDGEAFFFTVNNLSTTTRGVSELFHLADSIDGYEQLLYSILRQEQIASNYIFDVTLDGLDQKGIDAWLKDRRPPRPLSIRAHNEKEKWELAGPKMDTAASRAETARLQRNHVLGGAGVPEHYYGGGGDVNRAAAAEMGGPFEKAMTARQLTFRRVIEDVLVAQVESGIRCGALREADDVRDLRVGMPDLSTRDLSRVGAAMAAFAASLAQGMEQGLVDRNTAGRVLASLFSQAGVEVDPADMLTKADAERTTSLADQVSADLAKRQAAA
jgi:hypothetical protein